MNLKKLLLPVVLIVFTVSLHAAPLGTAFTYQGRLTDAGTPANGTYDFRFILFDVDAFGFPIGQINTNRNVPVINGLFTVSLDFSNAFDGQARWLEIGVRTNGAGVFTLIEPRQPVTPTPYALYAVNTGLTNGTVTSALIADNTIATADLTNDAVTSAKILNATILPADLAITSFATTFWKTDGNAGTTPGTHFLGTTDDQPVELKVNGMRVLRIEFGGDSIDTDALRDGAPNLIGGAAINYAAPETVGGVIAGGGATNFLGFALSNSIGGAFPVIGGGVDNTITTNTFYSSIGSGLRNFIDDAFGAGIGSGTYNTNYGYTAVIGGGAYNTILRDATDSTIAGGNANLIGQGAAENTIGGGLANAILDVAYAAAIVGGWGNTNSGTYSSIGGGYQNRIHTNAGSSTIAGGVQNVIQTNVGGAVIGGGFVNTISNGVDGGVIAGGGNNRIDASSDYATIGGGSRNNVSGNGSTVGGGISNRTQGVFATVPGGLSSTAGGQFSFAAGRRAQAIHNGAFVWADTNNFDFASTNANSFSARVTGGARFVSAVNASGVPIAGVVLTPGNGAWAAISDRNAKENFTPVNGQEVLEKLTALPLATWNYKSQDPSVRHIGPMAQDFKGAFGLGESELTITTIDADGVALAAIQGLNQKVEDKEKEIAQLRKSNAALENRLSVLEKLVGRLAP